MAMSVPISLYKRFVFNKEDSRRWGQQLYDFMELHKVTNSFDKVWCDKLYEQGPYIGRQMVLAVMDHTN